MCPSPDTTTRLCSWCDSANLGLFLAQADDSFASDQQLVPRRLNGAFSPSVFPQITLGTFDNDCQVCRLLWRVRLGATEKRSGYHLVAVPALWAYSFIKWDNLSLERDFRKSTQSYGIIVVDNLDRIEWESLEQSKFIFRTQSNDSDKIVPFTVPPNVDFNVIQGWVQFCQSNHNGAPCIDLHHCQKDFGELSNVTSFRLIDTESLTVVDSTPAETYVALSYVWGHQTSAGTSSDWPTVVHDAVTVTRELGYRYLWVDRYCIDQNNADDKHAQIMCMHLVYQNAQLTIIAAAGKDARHGLPGVNGKLRSSPLPVAARNIELISPPSDVQMQVRRSTWSTRGWTYQEGLLSRRRLIFTEAEVYFECNSMFCYESLRFDLPSLHEGNNRWFQSSLVPGVIDQRENFNPWHQKNDSWREMQDTLIKYICTYSKRDLSYESDRLDAFRGILRSFGYPTYYGLLLSLKDATGRKRSQSQQFAHMKPYGDLSETQRVREMGGQVLVALIGWSHCVKLGICLSSDRDLPHVSREPTLPSWTWVGWHGPLEMAMTDSSVGADSSMADSSATLEIRPKELNANLTEALSCGHDLSSVLSQYIWIKGRKYISWLDEFTLTSTSSIKNDRKGSFGVTTTMGSRSHSLRFKLSVSFPGIQEFLQHCKSFNIQIVYIVGASRGKAWYQYVFVVLRKSGKSPNGEIIWERIGLCLHDVEKWNHMDTSTNFAPVQIADDFEVYCIS